MEIIEIMTIFEEALKGNITKEVLHIAEIERVDIRKLMKKISKGEVVIMKRENFKPVGIGFPLRTKINVNLG
ncbi:MAG: phosphomethylpyrimidine synthase ThiC, partial [Promethearchaeota archaeon]